LADALAVRWPLAFSHSQVVGQAGGLRYHANRRAPAIERRTAEVDQDETESQARATDRNETIEIRRATHVTHGRGYRSSRREASGPASGTAGMRQAAGPAEPDPRARLAAPSTPTRPRA
jgi:hypothetical protein